jgi:hypothetical protein
MAEVLAQHILMLAQGMTTSRLAEILNMALFMEEMEMTLLMHPVLATLDGLTVMGQ